MTALSPVLLSLYIAGTTPMSARAVVNVRKLCDEHLAGRYELRVIDLLDDPRQAQEAQIVALPTLVKQLPRPVRKFIGDLSDPSRVLLALGLRSPPQEAHGGDH
jgi:circadian clock protein KaiB